MHFLFSLSTEALRMFGCVLVVGTEHSRRTQRIGLYGLLGPQVGQVFGCYEDGFFLFRCDVVPGGLRARFCWWLDFCLDATISRPASAAENPKVCIWLGKVWLVSRTHSLHLSLYCLTWKGNVTGTCVLLEQIMRIGPCSWLGRVKWVFQKYLCYKPKNFKCSYLFTFLKLSFQVIYFGLECCQNGSSSTHPSKSFSMCFRS